MIYTASYFESLCHHGRLISISRTIPKGFRVDGTLPIFVPAREILRAWKTGEIDEEGYKDRYRAQLQSVWPEVKAWVRSLDFRENATLLCWERAGEFCHRNLVGAVVEHLRPDVFGGRDVQYLTPESCPACGEESVSSESGFWCSSCGNCTPRESSDSPPAAEGGREGFPPKEVTCELQPLFEEKPVPSLWENPRL